MSKNVSIELVATIVNVVTVTVRVMLLTKVLLVDSTVTQMPNVATPNGIVNATTVIVLTMPWATKQGGYDGECG